MEVINYIGTHFLGTIVNFVCVLIAGLLGSLLKRGIPERFTKIITSAMAVSVIYIGIDGVLEAAPAVGEGSFVSAGLFKVLVMIVSMAIGAIIGELVNFDKLLGRLGDALGVLFKKVINKVTARKKEACENADSGEDIGERFARGFVACSLLFCVGAMAINGAIKDAAGDPSILLTKTVIDSITVFVMATSFGVGCAFSAFSVLVYQGVFNVVGIFLNNGLPTETITYMSVTGSLIIILLGLNVLGVTKVKTANLVPAMFVAIGVEALLRLIFGA